MVKYKDDIGREFVALSTLSALLNLSTKQVRNHVRDKRLLSIKRGRTRYVFKDDILKEYPDLTPSMLEREIIGEIGEETPEIREVREAKGKSEYSGDFSNFSNFPEKREGKEISLYERDKKQDLILRVVNRLEKGIADMGYTQQDTKAIRRDTIEIRKALKGNKGNRGNLIGFIVLGLVILGLIGAGAYGVNKFKAFYLKTRTEYEEAISIKDIQIDVLSDNYNETLLQSTIQKGQMELEIERLRNTNERLGETVEELQKGKRGKR